jgi:hypothetical protein
MNNIIRQAAWHFEAIQRIFKISMIFVCGAAQNKRFSIVLASTVSEEYTLPTLYSVIFGVEWPMPNNTAQKTPRTTVVCKKVETSEKLKRRLTPPNRNLSDRRYYAFFFPKAH